MTLQAWRGGAVFFIARIRDRMTKTGSKSVAKRKNTGEWKEVFLTFYRRFPSVTEAAKNAKVSRVMVYKEMGTDPDFKAAFEEARADGIQMVEDIAWELARDKDYHHNTLRIFLLKSLKRDVYGDQTLHEIGGKDGGEIILRVIYDNSNPKPTDADNPDADA